MVLVTSTAHALLMQHSKWLLRSAYITEISGMLMVVGALVPGALDAVVGMLFWPAVVVELGPPARLIAGVGGACLTGWATSMAMLARSLDRLDARVVGRALLMGVLTWFVLDGTVSITVGAYFNLIGNTIYLALLGLPMLALVRQPSSPTRDRVPAVA